MVAKKRPMVSIQPDPLSGGLRFAPPASPETKTEKPKREKKPKIENDPKYVAAARELRDRWLEKVNAEPALLTSRGKYELSRQITSETLTAALPSQRALPAKALAVAA
jgi:hypothetical protein